MKPIIIRAANPALTQIVLYQVKKQGYLKVAKKVLYRVCLLIPGNLRYLLPARYAMSGTEIAYNSSSQRTRVL
eukprot:580912-Rhodomonas_salina.3